MTHTRPGTVANSDARPNEEQGADRCRHQQQPCPDFSIMLERRVTRVATRRKNGAAGGTRTPDPRITNALLYHLSYCGLSGAAGTLRSRSRRVNAPAVPCWRASVGPGNPPRPRLMSHPVPAPNGFRSVLTTEFAIFRTQARRACCPDRIPYPLKTALVRLAPSWPAGARNSLATPRGSSRRDPHRCLVRSAPRQRNRLRQARPFGSWRFSVCFRHPPE